jgi:hypothetical protein
MEGFDLFFILKPFGNSTSWQDIHDGGASTLTFPVSLLFPEVGARQILAMMQDFT